MQLEIRYTNEFLYSQPARESHNQLRACPALTPTQRLDSYRLEINPRARAYSYTDYWGTRVDEFGIREPHRRLLITADSIVETSPPPPPQVDPPLATYSGLSADFVHYLGRSPHANWGGDVDEFAHETARGVESAVGVIDAVSKAINTRMEYRPGATYVGVDVGEVLSEGKGVCQDFTHLGLAMLRSLGVPARYVSGYLYAADQTNAVQPDEVELAVQTHAWLEAFVPGHGWWAVDPTNPQPVSELHVKIGHGRDYDDVMPLRGVYHGEVEHNLDVRVQISREQMSQAQQ